MICLMFVLEVLLGLKSLQGNNTCAFLHAELEETKRVCIKMPMSFSQYGKKMSSSSKKHSMGLRQSPRAFWKYITAKLHECGLEQLKFDPCLFIRLDVISVVYVNNPIFWSREVPQINHVAMELHKLDVDLERKKTPLVSWELP
jgi:hypothetical protein